VIVAKLMSSETFQILELSAAAANIRLPSVNAAENNIVMILAESKAVLRLGL
jgi:hypothetical protein